ncbi:hypothetical protein INT48_003508 [Thamnidium elegans]|uniref:Uncharacterized protein n=1 Tax=Thamnidium elegans TaxID=101142 RepID=A0A8H7W1L8_9FUNG|nr:hypothetical protein INT48_003508 [Thamnidium elegans]
MMQFPTEKSSVMTVENIEDDNSKASDVTILLKKTVRSSFVPNLLEENGEYSGLTKELHTGALVIDKEVIFTIASEAYSRSKATDIHGKSDPKSVPPESNSYYGSMCAGVYGGAINNIVQ